MKAGSISEHEHKYAMINTGADEMMRCVICRAPESETARMKREDDRIRGIITETVIADIKSNGPIRMALLGL